jgi:predicted O-methyltransferase YrrM
MFDKLIFRLKETLLWWFIRLHDRMRIEGAKSIWVARQERALASTVDFVEKYLRQVPSVTSKEQLLAKAFAQADVSGDRLICEFGVYKGYSINYLSKLVDKTIFGFDSFEGLPEHGGGDLWKKGDFALPKLPSVRSNVTLIKGWFNESLPPFLMEHPGKIGFLHVDSDLYSSCKIVLDLLESRLGPGAVIVFDEYFNFPQWEEGEHQAFQEFLARTKLSCEYIGYHRHGQQLALILKGSV